jgi:hypothetical protein
MKKGRRLSWRLTKIDWLGKTAFKNKPLSDGHIVNVIHFLRTAKHVMLLVIKFPTVYFNLLYCRYTVRFRITLLEDCAFVNVFAQNMVKFKLRKDYRVIGNAI